MSVLRFEVVRAYVRARTRASRNRTSDPYIARPACELHWTTAGIAFHYGDVVIADLLHEARMPYNRQVLAVPSV